jgi:hypothetical protein
MRLDLNQQCQGRKIYSLLGLPIFLHIHKFGAVDGNRTRLNLIDNQVPYPEDYNGKIGGA